MPVKIACPNPDCDASYSIADEYVGRLTRCKKCGTQFALVPQKRVETATSPAPETEPEPPASPRPPIDVDLPSPFGRYKIVRVLGRGGMGAVYLAQDSQLDRLVALKVPHREVAQKPEVRERFLREARAAAKFQHANFCPIFDIGEVDGIPYLTMAYIKGGTLASLIERGQPWKPRKAADVVRQLAVALAEAHRQGIIHRDLKPANIMIDVRGGLVLMDFGLARRFEADESALTAAGAVIGTPAYMPPEQAEGNIKAIGPRSDLYSLGVILYELLTGLRPFEGPITKVLGMIAFIEPDPPSTLRPGLDPRLEAICLKAMAKRIGDRYASMDEFAGALQAWLDDLESGKLLADSKKAEGGPRSVRTWIAAFAVLLFGIIIYVTSVNREPRRPPVVKVDPRPSPSALPVIQREPPGSRVAPPDPPKVKIEPVAPPAEPEPNPAAVAKVEPPPDPPKPPEMPKVVAEIPPPPKSDGTLITNTLGMAFKLIPAGDFAMGSDASDHDAGSDEKVSKVRKHRVRINKPFYLGTTEVTVGQFREFIERTGWKTDAERDAKGGHGWSEAKGTFEQDPSYTWRWPGFPQEDDHPVVNVSWNDAVAFCQWLSQAVGQTYRLPTEAEWEYACRAGQTSPFWFGDDPEGLAAVGNATGSHDGFKFTAPVGHFRPNAFGLFDMHGNVFEWCEDWYDPGYYAKSPAADPPGPAQGSSRVTRGGSWSSAAGYCRAAYRNGHIPINMSCRLGFRVARVK